MTAPLLIVQARLESTRLPEKVLEPILGQPMILHLLDRLRGVVPQERLMVATAHTQANARLVQLVDRHGYRIGMPKVDPDDVLGRYTAIAVALGAEVIIRVTGDSPLVDPTVIEAAYACYQSQPVDYVALAAAWPDGLDVEIIRAEALRTADRQATLASDREHVSAFLWRQPAHFRQALLPCPLDLSRHCWSVDTSRDLELVRAIYHGLYGKRAIVFGWRTVAAWLARHPEYERMATDHPRNAAYVAQIAAESGVEAQHWTALRYGEETLHGEYH